MKSAQERFDLPLLVMLALGMRVGASLAFRNMLHPDEIYQVLEQTHRMVFGYGIRPWELDEGMRSMLLPALLAVPTWATSRISDNPRAYLLVVQLLLACLSTMPVWFVYRFGRQLSRVHALVGAFVAATWFEAVSFSYHPLAEMIGGSLLVIALCVQSRPQKTRPDWITLGALLTLACGFRIQLLPAAAVMLWLQEGKSGKTWKWLAMGAAGPALVFGLADWVAWGYPFASFVNYLRVNLFEAKASTFGEQGLFWYLSTLGSYWSVALPLVAFLCICNWRKYQPWLAAAVALVVIHSLIPHKEYRFVEPAYYLLAIVAGLGSVDFAVKWLKKTPAPVLLAGALCALWLTISVSLALSGEYAKKWRRRTDFLDAQLALYPDPDLCGLLVFDHAMKTGGYTYLHRNVPIYWDVLKDLGTKRYLPAYNAVLSPEKDSAIFAPEFHREHCFETAYENVCILKRFGGCNRVQGYTPILEQKRFGEMVPLPPNDSIHGR